MGRPEVCGRCGQEVRYGVRPSPARPPADQDKPYWMHRDPADDLEHTVILGTPWTPELQVKIDAALAEMASRGKADDAKKKQQEEAEQAEKWDQIPPPEVPAYDIDVTDLPKGSGMVQIANLLNRTDGWEIVRLRKSRGPYIGARGQVLSISDCVRIGARGPLEEGVDGGRRCAVASWRDGGFDFAYTGHIRGRTVYTTAANFNGLKAFIRGE